MVRSHAIEWHFDPNRIGVLGFSAGAHLSAAVSTHFDKRLYVPIDSADKVGCRPDFSVIVYPGYLALSEQNLRRIRRLTSRRRLRHLSLFKLKTIRCMSRIRQSIFWR